MPVTLHEITRVMRISLVVTSMPLPSTFPILPVKPKSMFVSAFTLRRSQGTALVIGRRLIINPGRAWGCATLAAGTRLGVVIILRIDIPVIPGRAWGGATLVAVSREVRHR